MPRKATGTHYKSGDTWYAAVTLGSGKKGRKHVPMPVCKDEQQAAARTTLINELAQKLRASGHAEIAMRFLSEAGKREGKPLDRVLRAVDALAKGEAVPKGGHDLTVREIGKMWTSGQIAREHRDHVKPRKNPDEAAGQLELHVYPIVGDVVVTKFTLQDGEAVMRALPDHLGVYARIKVASF